MEQDDDCQTTLSNERTRRSTPTSGQSSSALPTRRRGRQSKDEQLAADSGLPVSAADIADVSLRSNIDFSEF